MTEHTNKAAEDVSCRFSCQTIALDALLTLAQLRSLLDIKQKQANLSEVHFSRRQSEESARQANTITFFTVVTIIFVSARCDNQVCSSHTLADRLRERSLSCRPCSLFRLMNGPEVVMVAFQCRYAMYWSVFVRICPPLVPRCNHC